MGAVAGDGTDGEKVFDLALEGVAGSIAAAASPSAGVHPHAVVFGEHSFDEGERVEVAVGAVDEHER